MAGFNLDNYVPVEERIEKFYEAHPDGTIQTEVTHLDAAMVVVKAYAYRSPDDKLPATGHSQMNIPGGTSFTKGSEVENAETSAVGRALAMMGFEVRRGVASRQEVRNKSALPPFPEEAPAPPPPDVPEWVAKFNADRKGMGIGNSLIEEVIGTKLSITNIEKWLDAEEGRTPDKLLSLAADRGAVGVK